MNGSIECESSIEKHSFALFNECICEVENGEFSPAIERDDQNNLLAPNGSISKLPNELFSKITRTPSFKEWFGDWVDHPDESSRAVDSVTEEPIVMYHQTDKKIGVESGLDERFSKGSLDIKAIYFRSVLTDDCLWQQCVPSFFEY